MILTTNYCTPQAPGTQAQHSQSEPRPWEEAGQQSTAHSISLPCLLSPQLRALGRGCHPSLVCRPCKDRVVCSKSAQKEAGPKLPLSQFQRNQVSAPCLPGLALTPPVKGGPAWAPPPSQCSSLLLGQSSPVPASTPTQPSPGKKKPQGFCRRMEPAGYIYARVPNFVG